ncbi:organomercurial lyase [Halosimplex halophilum]|uniref:organomercurial lyase n=1 Tax=Halosimplex halophilum TaxID=2559572 RepID=UPI0014355A3C|nr:organomercurial lyase [Halosimplex halophilum]
MSLPADVGEAFGRLYGTDPPATVGEWTETMRAVVEAERGRAPTVDDLCATADGDHAFVGEETEQAYICVLDPLVYPFLTGEAGTVRSTTPVRGTEVAFEIGEDGVAVSHDDAVVSIGVSTDPDRVDDAPVETVYREVCGYIQTFEDRAEYERWTEGVDAATTAVPAAVGVAVARALAGTLFDADPDGRTGAAAVECDCC